MKREKIYIKKTDGVSENRASPRIDNAEGARDDSHFKARPVTHLAGPHRQITHIRYRDPPLSASIHMSRRCVRGPLLEMEPPCFTTSWYTRIFIITSFNPPVRRSSSLKSNILGNRNINLFPCRHPFGSAFHCRPPLSPPSPPPDGPLFPFVLVPSRILHRILGTPSASPPSIQRHMHALNHEIPRAPNTSTSSPFFPKHVRSNTSST